MRDRRDQTRVSRRTVLRATVVAMAGGIAMQARADQKIASTPVAHNQPDRDGTGSACAPYEPPAAGGVDQGAIGPEGGNAALASTA